MCTVIQTGAYAAVKSVCTKRETGAVMPHLRKSAYSYLSTKY